jgi:molybdate-binding protein/DNA-binding PadR family transcriptional regulator
MSPLYPLLGLLARGERYGYELKRIVDDEYAPFWRIDFAQLYRSLAKMTRADWARVRVARGDAGPDRKVYTLTARGRKQFDAWLNEPARDRDEFFVKLKLATALDAPVARLLETQRAAFERERDQRAESQRAARDTGDAGRLFIADAALRETQAALATLDLSAALAPRARGIARESSARPLVIIGSDDPLLARLAQTIHATTRAVGSVGGLLALANREADIAGAHLLDVDTREYNVPFVRHLLPEDEMVLVNLAVRENGLLIARGNPKNLRGVRDLTRRDVRLINRQRGAGTRLLLFAKLRAARIDARALRDWDRVAQTHDAVAAAIATGAVDVGPGLRATAHAWNLDFIPLGEERFDLVIPRVEFESPRLRPILDALHSKSFRDHALAGYDLARTGRVVARVR